jgi:hypothetical protein
MQLSISLLKQNCDSKKASDLSEEDEVLGYFRGFNVLLNTQIKNDVLNSLVQAIKLAMAGSLDHGACFEIRIGKTAAGTHEAANYNLVIIVITATCLILITSR